MNTKSKPKPQFLFAVVWEDTTGQIINLFKTHKQATEFYETLKQVQEAEVKLPKTWGQLK